MRTRMVVAATFAAWAVSLAGCGSADVIPQAAIGLSDATGPPPFSNATKAKIKEQAGATFDALDPNKKPPVISLSRAIQLAGQNFTGILQGKRPAEAQYGLVTNSRSGQLQADRSIKPSIDHQPIWLIFYRDIEMAISSNVSRPNNPLMNHSDFLVYVDATTGHVPTAESI